MKKILQQVTIPRNIVEIQSLAFNDYGRLKSLKFEAGSKLSKIGDEAF